MSPPDKNGAADLEDHVPELRLLPVWAHEGEEIIESKQRDYHSESFSSLEVASVMVKRYLGA